MAAIEFPTNPARDATFTDAGGTPWVCDNSISSGDTYTSWSKAIPIAAESIVVTPSGNIAAINVGTAIAELDTEKVNKVGDTLTGQLKGITPVAVSDLTRKDYVDGLTTTLSTEKVAKAGDTMTGQLKGITPVAAEDLARKDYVDTGIVSSASVSNRGKNLLDNGDLSIWQRGESFVVDTYKYTADRWFCLMNELTSSVDRVINTSNDGMGDAIKLSQGASTFAHLRQGVEWNNQFIPGSKWTVSYDCRSIDGATIQERIAITDNIGVLASIIPIVYEANHSLVSSFTRYSFTFTIPAGVPITAEMLVVNINNDNSASNTSMEVRRIQLEAGEFATDFEITHPQEQLARCHRFCQVFPELTVLATGYSIDSATGYISYSPPTSFKQAPIVESASTWKIYDGAGQGTLNLTLNHIMLMGPIVELKFTDGDTKLEPNGSIILQVRTAPLILSADYI